MWIMARRYPSLDSQLEARNSVAFRDVTPERTRGPQSVAVMDGKGKLIMECIPETKADTILEFLGGLIGVVTPER